MCAAYSGMSTGFSFLPSEYADLARSAGIYSRADIETYDHFARFGYMDPYSMVTHAREHVFFTKPDLHLFNGTDYNTLNPELKNSAFFIEMHERFLPILKQLSISHNGNVSPFINLLYNGANSGVDLPSLDALEMDTGATVYGEMIKYRGMSVDLTHDFSMEFLDTKYLEIYLLSKTWDEYERRKAVGLVTPPNDTFITNKILHDQVCCYKFITAEDGETLLYYAKLYGVYMKNVPRDIFSNIDRNGPLTMSLNFNADFIEDMDPSILVDFNEIALKYNSTSPTIPIYNGDKQHNMINGQFCNMPYVVYVPKADNSINRYSHYKLRWR